jgi:hypothetical protein
VVLRLALGFRDVVGLQWPLGIVAGLDGNLWYIEPLA